MPEGTLAGGGIPGPTLDVQVAATAIDAGVAAVEWSGIRIVMNRRIAPTRPATGRTTLGRAGLRFLWVDPKLRERLRDLGRAVLLGEGECVQRRRRHALGVDLEVAPQCLASVAAPEAVGAERNEGIPNPPRDLIGQGFEPVRRGHDRRMPAENRRDMREARLGLRMQPVPPLDRERLVAKLLVARDAVHVRAHVVFLLQKLLRAQDLPHDRSGSEERDPPPPTLRAWAKEIEAADDSFLDSLGHRGLRVVLVVEGQVVEDVLTVAEHPLDALANDDGGLVRERRVVRADIRDRRREDLAVPVLMLQALAVQGRAARGRAAEEPAAPRVAERPDLIAGSLQTEHR